MSFLSVSSSPLMVAIFFAMVLDALDDDDDEADFFDATSFDDDFFSDFNSLVVMGFFFSVLPAKAIATITTKRRNLTAYMMVNWFNCANLPFNFNAADFVFSFA